MYRVACVNKEQSNSTRRARSRNDRRNDCKGELTWQEGRMRGEAKRLCALGGGSDNAAIFRHSFKELGLQKLVDQRKKRTNRAERLQTMASEMCGRINKSPPRSSEEIMNTRAWFGATRQFTRGLPSLSRLDLLVIVDW